MHVTYGFVFYYTIIMALLTFGLVFFIPRATRRIFFNILKKLRLGENQMLLYVVYLCYAIILIILADALWTYFTMRKMMQLNNASPLLNDYEVFQQSFKGKDVMGMFKEQREFYMAERNFMLTAAALLVSFLFHKFVAAFSKLNDIENQIEAAGSRPSSTDEARAAKSK